MKKLLATPIGAILLAIAILIDRYLPSNPFFDFTSGFLLGLSIVLNIYYIIVISGKTKNKDKK